MVARGEGAIVEDVDGNRFLDFNAGIAVLRHRPLPSARGRGHPQQAARLIHMSGTDFYYENMVALAEKLARLAPGGAGRAASTSAIPAPKRSKRP